MGVLSQRTDRASFAFEDIELTLNGELATEIEAREQAAAQVRRTTADDRLTAKSKADALDAELDELMDSMAEDIFTLRLRALPRTVWYEITTKNPARRGDPLDTQLGMNVDAVTRAAVERNAVVIEDGESVKPDPEEWPAFWDALTTGQFVKLRDVVWALNGTGLNVDRLKKA